jgi:membrane protein
VRSQLGVARYNALYSGLGAIPIFLVWTYVSWIVVLVGAQLAASHQNDQLAGQQFRMRHADQALREMVAVALGAVIARDFLAGGPRRSGAGLADLLEIPPQLVDDVLDALSRAGLVVRAVFGRELAYVPGGDVDTIRADDLRQALRRDPAAEDVRDAVARLFGPDLQRVVREVEAGRGRGDRGPTLRELAAAVGDPGAPRLSVRPGGAARTEPPRNGGDVVDAKQPDVPS